MTVSVKLEDFGLSSLAEMVPPDSASAADPGLGEAERAAVYEEAYRAGWDDAAAAQVQDRARIDAEFARNLQEISFTFYEARAHVVAAMKPLLEELLQTLFPALVADSFRDVVLHELSPLVEDAADTPVELAVAPGGAALLAESVRENAAAAVEIREDPALAEGQAFLRVGKAERQIDMTGALQAIRDAVAALHDLNERTLKHA